MRGLTDHDTLFRRFMQLYLHYTDKISVKMVPIRSNNRTQRQQLKTNRQVASKERKKEKHLHSSPLLFSLTLRLCALFFAAYTNYSHE